MGAPYHQYCPVAKAMELFDERWTLLVVRELGMGSRQFNEMRRGLPTMSPTLLSKRLRELAQAGLVDRQEEGAGVRYLLTQAGEELLPVVAALGAWGVRWMGELGDRDLDPRLLMWDLHRTVEHAAMPPGRTVVRFHFSDVPPRQRAWWLVVTDDDADVCDFDPGFPVGAAVFGELRALVRVHLGDETWTQVQRSGRVVLEGPSDTVRQIPDWFPPSRFAAVPRVG